MARKAGYASGIVSHGAIVSPVGRSIGGKKRGGRGQHKARRVR